MGKTAVVAHLIENYDQERDLMKPKSIPASIVGFVSVGTCDSVLYYPHFRILAGHVSALRVFHLKPNKGLCSAYKQI